MIHVLSRRGFLRGAAAAASLAISSSPPARAAGDGEHPNVLFFFVDDQRSDTLGCTGHPILQTPNVDSLASRGVRFRNAFVTTSICAASRATVFTGLYERTHGYTFGTPPIREAFAAVSYPAAMRDAGYRTGFIGKFGVSVAGKGRQRMFDYFKPLNRNPYFHEMLDGTKRHETEIAGDHAVEFLCDNPDDAPFCLSISFNAVHAEDGDKEDHYPWPKAVNGMYEDVEIPAPRLSSDALYEAQPEFLKQSLNRERYFWRWDTPEKYDRNMRAYFRMISGVDRVIGRVLHELDALGLADNTVVVYAADNGYYMGDRGFAGKWSHYEQSLRVPVIVFDPRLEVNKRGRVVDPMALNVDLPATILDLAGVEVPASYQGRSLAPLVRGEDVGDWRTDFFCEHLMDHKAIPKWEGVRGSRYVYARYFEQTPPYEFLHDLDIDPNQFVNLASSSHYKEVLDEMRARCDALKRRYERARREGGQAVSSVQPLNDRSQS